MNTGEQITRIFDIAYADKIEIYKADINGDTRYWVDVFSNITGEYVTSQMACSVDEAVDDLMRKFPNSRTYIKLPHKLWNRLILSYTDLVTNKAVRSESVNTSPHIELLEICKNNIEIVEEQ